MSSPYANLPVSEWATTTEELIHQFPLSEQEVVAVVLDAWVSILQTRIGAAGYQIGKDMVVVQLRLMSDLVHRRIAASGAGFRA